MLKLLKLQIKITLTENPLGLLANYNRKKIFDNETNLEAKGRRRTTRSV